MWYFGILSDGSKSFCKGAHQFFRTLQSHPLRTHFTGNVEWHLFKRFANISPIQMKFMTRGRNSGLTLGKQHTCSGVVYLSSSLLLHMLLIELTDKQLDVAKSWVDCFWIGYVTRHFVSHLFRFPSLCSLFHARARLFSVNVNLKCGRLLGQNWLAWLTFAQKCVASRSCESRSWRRLTAVDKSFQMCWKPWLHLICRQSQHCGRTPGLPLSSLLLLQLRTASSSVTLLRRKCGHTKNVWMKDFRIFVETVRYQTRFRL